MPDMSATTKADGRTLPWRILPRRQAVRARGVVLHVRRVLRDPHRQAIGQLLDEFPGQLVGVAGFAAVMLLWVGWWCQRDDWMAHGPVYHRRGVGRGVGRGHLRHDMDQR
jgi:hypothetical protein